MATWLGVMCPSGNRQVLGGIIDSNSLYSLAADAILVTHVLFDAFAVVGLVLF